MYEEPLVIVKKLFHLIFKVIWTIANKMTIKLV